MRSALTLGLVLLFGCPSATAEVKKDAVTETPRLLVAMERGPCFGACPVYRVEVFTDGRVRFEGRRHVKMKETVETRLSGEQLAAISERIKNLGFKWGDYNDPSVTDLPSVRLTIGDQTLSHAIGDRRAPYKLTKLEDDLDTLIGTAKWINGAAAEAVDR
ncbi:MAG TPA: DUF6438 domain-containing protein [Archangium sp.]